MTDNQFSGEIGNLGEADTAAYERATDIYRALLGVLDARIDRETDPAAAERLQADAVRYAGEQRALRVGDRAGVQRVIDQYPALVRELQAALGW